MARLTRLRLTMLAATPEDATSKTGRLMRLLLTPQTATPEVAAYPARGSDKGSDCSPSETVYGPVAWCSIRVN